MVDTNTTVRAPEASNPHEACKAEVEKCCVKGDFFLVVTLELSAHCFKSR